jgi:hypothetical protein
MEKQVISISDQALATLVSMLRNLTARPPDFYIQVHRHVRHMELQAGFLQ